MVFDRNEIANALWDQTLYDEAINYEDCGTKGLVFKCMNPCHDYRGYVPLRCDLRICPNCGERFASKIFVKYVNPIKFRLSHPKKTYSLKFLTLTKVYEGKFQNSEEFRKEMKKFNKNVRIVMNKLFPKSSNSGGISVLEVGKNFNIHAHIVVYGRYYPQNYLSKFWKKVTRDSFIVDIRRVKGKTHSVLGYLIKYIVKPCNFNDASDYAVYLKALKSVRRVHSFGIFYNTKLPEKDKFMRCPYCDNRLVFDAKFYGEVGKLNIQFLKHFLGINEVSFN